MKHTLLWVVILMIAICSLLCPEEIEVQYQGGTKILKVPDTYSELRLAFITMSQLYLDERYDHEKSLAQIQELLNTKPLAPEPVQNIGLLGASWSLSPEGTMRYEAGIGYSCYLLEKGMVTFIVQYPLQVSVFFGIRLQGAK